MRVPRAFRSLARPSSALEPSHSPAGTVASSVVGRLDVDQRCQVTIMSPDCIWFTDVPRTRMSSVDVWIARIHGRHRITLAGCSSNPSHSRFPGMVHRSSIPTESRLPLKGTDSRRGTWTHWDSNPGHPPCKGGTLPLSYEPTFPRWEGCGGQRPAWDAGVACVA